MPNENVQKWIEALRSGRYEQGRRVLRNEDDEFCCLGVACDLYHKEHPDQCEWVHDTNRYRCVAETGSSLVLPLGVMNWLGLADDLGTYHTDIADGDALTTSNDRGKTFSEIADIIESNPPGLFNA